LVAAVFLVGFVLLCFSAVPSRDYGVTVDSVSGLELPPSKDLALDPRFNLTLRLASSNPFRHECMDADTYVQVSYRCVPLAASAAAPHRLCVGPKKSTDVQVVAEGTGVRLPGFLMDSLSADMRSGTAAFEVRLKQSGSTWVASCGARRAGDGGARCGDDWDMCTHHDHTSSSNPVFIPPPIFVPPEE
jgi:hypothetical protein